MPEANLNKNKDEGPFCPRLFYLTKISRQNRRSKLNTNETKSMITNGENVGIQTPLVHKIFDLQ